MTVVASIRSIFDSRTTRECARRYASAQPASARAAVQRDLLNQSWSRAVETVPYFTELQKSADLPLRFESLEEFAATVPVMNRHTIQEQGRKLASVEREPDCFRITGGSTAEPVQIPAWKSEFTLLRPDMWLARSWYGVHPESKLVLLWGHSHLLGSGLRGRIAGLRRNLSDRLLGYRRISAYDLSEGALRRACEELVRFRPDYVIGYSVALDLFARANVAHRDALRDLGIKVVIGAAEGFPESDSESRVSDLFGCPVAMEYGSVETGLVAHTHPEGGYRVLWRSYLVEAERTERGAPLRITSLYPRCVPLIRYEIGDEVELWDEDDTPVTGIASFKRVTGRCNAFISLSDGFLAHSEVITHAVRGCAAVRSYQVVQDGKRIELIYTAPEPLTAEDERGIRERLGKVHEELARIPFEHANALRQTIAGKTPMIIRR